jgi:hypothetical protein
MFKVLKWTSILASLTFAVGAAAADGDMMDSEYLHQTGAGVFDVQAGFGQAAGDGAILNNAPTGYSMINVSIRNSSLKASENSLPINVMLEYGINQMFSAGLELAYGTGQLTYSGCPTGFSCNSQHVNGMYDPQLFFKGRSAVGAGVIQYGAVLDVSVEKETTSSTGDQNNASGGISFTPFVAYQMAAGPGTWGARLQYGIYQGDKKSTDSSSGTSVPSTTSSNGNWVIDTFYEAPVAGITIGGALSYAQNPETKTSQNGGPKTGNLDAYNTMGVQVYVPVKLSSLTILPSVTYDTMNFSQSNSVASSENMIEVGVAARMSF